MKSEDLYIYQGDDFTAEVEVMNPDGTPADLATYVTRAQIRADAADNAPDVIIDIETTLINDNVILLFIDHNKTLTLGASSYVWDLQVTNEVGVISTIVRGRVLVTLEVTR